MLGRQNQQMCTVERVAVSTTFISQCVGKHYTHIHQTRAALTLYRFILVYFPSVVFYSKIFEKFTRSCIVGKSKPRKWSVGSIL